MKKRWLASAILQSEERMHRLSGFMSIKPLIKSREKVLSEEKIKIDLTGLTISIIEKVLSEEKIKIDRKIC